MRNCIFLLIVLLSFFSCNKKDYIEKIKIEGAVFGTSYSIIYLNKGEDYRDDIQELFDNINNSLSTYIPTSDISKINKENKNIIVDDYFVDVFNLSKKIYTETDGYFDPTVGSLVNAWGFGPEKQINNLQKYQVDSLLQFVGFDKIKLNKRTIVKQNPGIYLDFNSIAKGYAVDVVANFLTKKNIDNYLVEIGGEIRTKGKNDKNKHWRVGIDNPNFDGTRTISKYINLDNQAVASSGNYRKYRLDGLGKKYVHTINPKTGFAKASNLLAATVFGNIDCAAADAYATAFMAMGLEKTKAFLQQHEDLKVILYYLDENQNLTSYSNYTYK